MRVFKFGGASVKDASAIQNVTSIIQSYVEEKNPILMVVSAIGKTTNKLEIIAKKVFEQSEDAKTLLKELIEEHRVICRELKMSEESIVYKELADIETKTLGFIVANESNNFNYIYDQIVSKGELLSTTVVYHYILSQKVSIDFVNARYLIKTDNNYTDANILWHETQEAVDAELKNHSSQVLITQGFIGANSEMLYTTLGREGSDYTAAILAKCTNTKEMTIWKDVDGVYTADPKKFAEATIINKLSYKEAIEMTFYGAQIIHPKTIKPIQNSNCILKVKSFIHKEAKGTEIGNFENIHYQPVIVLKENQVLYSFSVRDFSFLNESNLGKIIATFGKYSLRINLMQNSSIEFLVLTDEKLGKNELIVEDLKEDFEIKMENHLKLLTIRHYTEDILEKQRKNKAVLITQKGEDTVHYLMR
ncbi:MAG: aspartate kinase [Chitinophagales bacterium]|jgi:aspartate kinase|nr:aspartate kinase [Sphingobacteriales bacterium]